MEKGATCQQGERREYTSMSITVKIKCKSIARALTAGHTHVPRNDRHRQKKASGPIGAVKTVHIESRDVQHTFPMHTANDSAAIVNNVSRRALVLSGSSHQRDENATRNEQQRAQDHESTALWSERPQETARLTDEDKKDSMRL